MTFADTQPLAAEPYRFLVVDDSRAIRAIVRRAVERCGYPLLDVRVAPDGEIALQLMPDFRPHLVITDWHMPRVSGLELMQTVRQVGWAGVKIGMVTTETSAPLLQEARQNGAAFILHKPFHDDELIRLVQGALPPDAAPPATAGAWRVAPPVPPGPGHHRTAPSAAGQPTLARPAPAANAAASGAPAMAGEAGGTGASLISARQCQPLLRALMTGVPFTLTDEPPLLGEDLTPQALLGLYGGQGRALSAIAVLDTHAVCILGGGAGRLSPRLVRPLMQSGQPSSEMVGHATRFMTEAGKLLRVPGESAALPLSRASLAPRAFPKLKQVLARNAGRADFRISVPGYGDGRLSFLAV